MSNNNPNLDPEEQGRINYKKGYLTLPFTQDQFSEFISGLFGTPEVLERRINSSFEIELGDIINLYYLIENRVTQQNKGILAQFSAKIFYDDNTSMLLNSFQSFSNYVEPRSVIPVKKAEGRRQKAEGCNTIGASNPD